MGKLPRRFGQDIDYDLDEIETLIVEENNEADRATLLLLRSHEEKITDLNKKVAELIDNEIEQQRSIDEWRKIRHPARSFVRRSLNNKF